MGNKINYPVVVIGAGLGYLCAAAYLSKFGVPVTVVEQHMIPGGYATAFDRGGLTFEVSLHRISINNNTTGGNLRNGLCYIQPRSQALSNAFAQKIEHDDCSYLSF